MIKKYRLVLLLLFTYSLLPAIFTYPLIFKFTESIYGYPSDIIVYLGYLWMFRESIPQIGGGILPPLFDFFSKALALVFDEVVVLNLLSFFRLPLAGLAMYFLCRKILRGSPRRHLGGVCGYHLQGEGIGEQLETPERNLFSDPGAELLAAFLAGFIFSFSLYSLWQGMVHIDLALIFWLPLFVLCLLNLWERPNFKNAFWAAVVFALTFSTSFYYGYFLALFSVGFLIFAVMVGFVQSKDLSFKSFLVSCLSAVALAKAGLLSLIFISPILLSAFQSRNSSLIAKTLESRGPEQLVSLGAKPWDYLMPSIYHPVFGGWVEEFYEYNQEKMQWYRRSAYLPERMVFLGFTPLVLAILATWWGRKDTRFKRYVWLFAFLALWCAWISAPSYTFVKGIKIYFPSYFLYKFFPMFRVYARMGILVLLCVSVLASIGIVLTVEKLQRIKPLKIRKFFIFGLSCLPASTAFLIFSLILFENFNFPPFHVTDVSLRPQVYEWLAGQSGEIKIAEYPVDTSSNDYGGGCPDWLDPEIRREYPGYYSALFQRIHRKDVLDYGSLPAEEKVALIDLSKPNAYEVLSSHEVDYIIIHTKDYFPQKNPFDECQERRVMNKPENVFEGFELVEEFEDGVVYRILKN